MAAALNSTYFDPGHHLPVTSKPQHHHHQTNINLPSPPYHHHPHQHLFQMSNPPESNQQLQFSAAAAAAVAAANAVATANAQTDSSQRRPSTVHRRVSSGQPSVSGLSMLKNGNGSTNGNSITSPLAQSALHQQQSSQHVPPGLGSPAGLSSFDPGRSPPGSKNLSHVPCKFFRQGACQAGKACPFLHSYDSTTDQTPCKYFQKGNCKFGIKCALAHILPDGRRINRPSMNNSQLQLGPRIVPEYNNHRASALHNSLIQANMLPPSAGLPYDGYAQLSGAEQKAYEQGLYNMDPLYGSPREDHMSPLASSHRTLGPLDAALPASLDSNGISYYARHGPIAASVPSKFGLESPPPSLPRNDVRGSTLRSLHQSAFGDEPDQTESFRAERSPPPAADDPTFGQRIMQSHYARRTRMMSSSFPRTSGLNADNWIAEGSDIQPADPTTEGNFAFEEDFIPSSLQELLTPQERNRRMSKTDTDEMAAGGSWQRNGSYTGPTTPGDAVGSPNSRFGALFSRQRREDDGALSAIGHVGSPLRNSYAHDSSPPFGPIGRPESGDVSAYLSSPTKQSSSSNISLHLQRVRRNDSYSNGEPSPLGPKPSMNGTPTRPGLDKTPSSTSITGKPFSIDEDTQFYMEDAEEDIGSRRSARKQAGLGLDGGDNPLLKEMENLYVGR